MCLGIPGQVVEITNAVHLGDRREINVGLVMGDVGGLKVGDWVLIHVGFAMTKIDEEEAARNLAWLKELGSVYDDEIDQFRESTPL